LKTQDDFWTFAEQSIAVQNVKVCNLKSEGLTPEQFFPLQNIFFV